MELSTVNWSDNMSELQTESWSNESLTTSARGTPGGGASLLLIPQKTIIIVLGVLGALISGFVLIGFGLSAGRSKLTSSMAHIANHTTLGLWRRSWDSIVFMYSDTPHSSDVVQSP